MTPREENAAEREDSVSVLTPSIKPQGPMRMAGPAVGLGSKTSAGDRLGIPAKLRVNDPGDKYEKEAERVADAVMRMEKPESATEPGEDTPSDRIQRMCPRYRRRDRQGKALNCEECEQELHRTEGSGDCTAADSKIRQKIQSLRGRGRPLTESTRSFFEPRFGRDFGDVRIHTGKEADGVARAVNARAFTLGNDIAFRLGTYRPRTKEGKKLLAHELAHVTQSDAEGDTLRRATVDASCASSKPFVAEQRGGMTCQNGEPIENGTTLRLSFAELPNRCEDDDYDTNSYELIQKALDRVESVVSSSSRPDDCLPDPEFKRGVARTLENVTVLCEADRNGSARAGIISNTVHLRHGQINSESVRNLDLLAQNIFHEVMHIWEGRFRSLLPHSGVVAPCSAACFPEADGQVGVNTDPGDCRMPPTVRPHAAGLGFRIETTRGGVGLVTSYRRKLFEALKGRLVGYAGLELSYTRLFSTESTKRRTEDVPQVSGQFGTAYRPEAFDRKGWVIDLGLGPSAEIESGAVRPGFRFSLGAGYEFDFLFVGGEVGVVQPLSEEAERVLDFTLGAEVDFPFTTR